MQIKNKSWIFSFVIICVYICVCAYFVYMCTCILCHFFSYVTLPISTLYIPASKYLLCICAGVPFTNKNCLKSTLGFNVDCEVVICKGTYLHTCVPTYIVWHLWSHYYILLIVSVDSLAHASERELVFAMIVQAGRIGIMTNTALLMEDIRLLSPTTLSTTPR